MEKVIFKYLDRMNYKLVKQLYQPLSNVKTIKSTAVFFVREGHHSGDIRFNFWDHTCYVSGDLVDSIASMLSVDEEDVDDVKDAVADWVENKLNKQVDYYKTFIAGEFLSGFLEL